MSATLPLEDNATMADGDLRRDVRVESLLRDWNLEFEFDPEYPLKKVDTTEGDLQVRDVGHRAPTETVEEYATQMRGGALFPPMILNHKGRMIDGNTRLGAAQRIGDETFPAYLVKLPRLDFGPMIGAAINQMGGKRLTPEESLAAAEKMMKEGYADEAIARALGRSTSMVRNYRRERRFAEAAKRLDLGDVKIARGAQRHLAGITHDEPFKRAATLTAAAKVAPKDVQTMVAKVADARSEREELEVIAEYEQKFKPAGPPPHRANPNRVATQAGRKVDTLLAGVTAPAHELAPAALRNELEPKWRKLHELAGSVLAAFDTNGS